MDDDRVIQVVMVSAVREAYEDFLASRGLKLVQIPSFSEDEDGIPTYIVSFT